MKVTGGSADLQSDAFAEKRESMVERQLRQRGIADQRVLQTMASIPRQEFVPAEWRERAYQDEPLPIGGGQTISQPFIVALMTAALRLSGSERVLEIGTGCGYQAAVLSRLGKEVYSVELRPELAQLAAERLERLGFANVHVHCGDGSAGLPDFAPYDAILVAAAAPSLPEPLLRQLSDSGRLIVPVGDASHQMLVCARRQGDKFSSERHGGCRFVPLLGRFGWDGSDLL